MERSIALLVLALLVAVLCITPHSARANYIVGLANDTWVNITITGYAGDYSTLIMGNVTGYLGEILNTDGIKTYTFTFYTETGYDMIMNGATYPHRVRGKVVVEVSFLRINNTYDFHIIAQYTMLQDTNEQYTQKPCTVYVTLIPKYADVITTLLLSNNTIVPVPDTSWVNLTNLTKTDPKLNGLVYEGLSYQAYNSSNVPKFEESEITFLADNETVSSTPPTPWITYWIKDNVSVNVENAIIPESQWLEGKSVVFYPELYSDWLIKIYWADGANGTVYYARNYGTLGEIMSVKKVSYPKPPIAYVVLASDYATNFTVKSMSNGLTVDRAENVAQHLFVASKNALYLVTAGDSSQIIQGVSGTTYYFSQKPLIQISLPSTVTNVTHTENLWLPEETGKGPSFPELSQYEIGYILVVYAVAGAIIMAFPNRYAWLGLAIVAGLLVVLRQAGFLSWVGDGLFTLSVLVPAFLALVLAGVSRE